MTNKFKGRPWLSRWRAVWCSCRLWCVRSGGHAPVRRVNSPPDCLLILRTHPHAGRCPVGFEVGRINHHGLLFAVVSRQTGHHPGEDAFVAPSLPAIVQGLVRAVLLGCVPPSQAITIDKDNPAQNPSIIDTGLAMELGEQRSRRAIWAALNQKRSDMFTARFRTVNHATSPKSMRP